MKKFLSIVITLTVLATLCMALCACGNSDKVNVAKLLKKCDKTQTVSQLSDGDWLEIGLHMCDVYIHPINGSSPTVSWKEDAKLSVSVKQTDLGTELYAGCKDASLVSVDKNSFVVVGIPDAWQKSRISVYGSTGSVQVEDLELTFLSVVISTGSIYVEDCEADGHISLATSSGAVYAEVESASVFARSDEGNVTVKADCSGSASIQTSAGSIRAELDEANVSMITDTGDIKFNIKATEITTIVRTGAIRGTIEGKKEQYTITARTNTGNCNLQNQTGDGEHILYVVVDVGDVKISFEK